MKKLDSIIVNKIVLGVNVIAFGKVVSFYYNDGTVEYRDRFTMHELYREENLDRIHSILEAGFSQSGGPSCEYVGYGTSSQLTATSQVYKWPFLPPTIPSSRCMKTGRLNGII